MPKLEIFAKQTYPYSGMFYRFMTYIMLPVILLFLGIIYIYSVLLAITRDLPSGQVVYTMLSLLAPSVIVFIVLEVMRHKHNWLKIPIRILFCSIVPLLGIYFYVIYLRIAIYGFTVERYLVVLIGVLLLIVCFYYVFSAGPKLKYLLTLTTTILLLSAVGPWSAYSLAE